MFTVLYIFTTTSLISNEGKVRFSMLPRDRLLTTRHYYSPYATEEIDGRHAFVAIVPFCGEYLLSTSIRTYSTEWTKTADQEQHRTFVAFTVQPRDSSKMTRSLVQGNDIMIL
jgi:hypothetical protein